jgi:hypothetical protein
MLGGDPQSAALAARADHERHAAARRQRIAFRLDERVVGLRERCFLALPERADRARTALEPVHALLERRKGDPEHAVLALVPPGADAEVEPAAAQLRHRRRPLGEQRRMIEGQRRHEDTEANARRGGGQPRQRGPGVERRALRVAEEPGQMIRAEQRLEAAVLRRACKAPPALPGEPFLSFDHQRQSKRHRHRPSVAICACVGAPVSYDRDGAREFHAACLRRA